MSAENEVINVLNKIIRSRLGITIEYDNNLEINDEKLSFTVNNKKFSCDSNLSLNAIKEKIEAFLKTF